MQRALQAAGRHKKDRVVGLGVLQKESHVQVSPVTISITDLLRNVNKKESTLLNYVPQEVFSETEDGERQSERAQAIKTYAWMRQYAPSVTLSIGHNGEVATVYNVSANKNSVPPSAKIMAVVGSQALGETLSKNSISNSPENVKTYAWVQDKRQLYLHDVVIEKETSTPPDANSLTELGPQQNERLFTTSILKKRSMSSTNGSRQSRPMRGCGRQAAVVPS